jgi:hypothetical protein
MWHEWERSACRNLFGKTTGIRLHERHRSRWEKAVKTFVKQGGSMYTGFIKLKLRNIGGLLRTFQLSLGERFCFIIVCSVEAAFKKYLFLNLSVSVHTLLEQLITHKYCVAMTATMT